MTLRTYHKIVLIEMQKRSLFKVTIFNMGLDREFAYWSHKYAHISETVYLSISCLWMNIIIIVLPSIWDIYIWLWVNGCLTAKTRGNSRASNRRPLGYEADALPLNHRCRQICGIAGNVSIFRISQTIPMRHILVTHRGGVS